MRVLKCLAAVLFLISCPLLSQTVQYSYDQLGRLVGVIDTSGNSAHYSYDANGNVTKITRYTSAQLSVIAFNPSSGPVGTVVTILGTHFNPVPSQNAVSFNGTAATVISSTTSQIVVSVPSGATTGTISVANSVGSTTSVDPFSVNANAPTAPNISSFSPIVATVGTTVSLAGSNFSSTLTNNRISVGSPGLSAAPSAATPTALAFSVPSNGNGTSGSGHITVQTPFGISKSNGDLYVPPSPYTASQVVTPQRITIGTTTSLEGEPNDIGMLLFDGTAGQQVTGVVDYALTDPTYSGLESCPLIYDPTGAPVSTGGCAGYGDIFATGIVTLPVTGTYAMVPLFEYAAGADATLSSVLHSTLSLNKSTTLTFTSPYQNAVITFPGTAGQTVFPSLQSDPSSGIGMYISDPNGTFWSPNNVSPNLATAALNEAATGTYSMFVNGGPVTPSTFTVALNSTQLTPTTTTLASSTSSTTPGSAVTLTASVSGSSPTGSIVFFDGNTILSTVSLAAGTTSYTVSSIPSGIHNYVAAYGGDSQNASSKSSLLAVSAQTSSPTTTAISASSVNPSPGANITLTAVVASSSATGTITFFDNYAGNSSVIGTATISGGIASYQVSSIALGAHIYTAVYGGNSSYSSSSSTALPVFALYPTTVSLSPPSNPSPASGASVSLTATATAAGQPATGYVSINDSYTGNGEQSSSGTTSPLSGGTATYTETSLAAGVHIFTASYLGNGSTVPSTSLPVVVSTLPSLTTTLTSSNMAPATGSSITLTGTVANASATGTLTFLDGATTVGTSTLSSGSALFTVGSVSVGPHTYTAVYSGNSVFASSTSAAILVTAGQTSIALSSSSMTPAPGSSITLAAKVTSNSATGTVSFLDGSTTIGTGTLSGGSASYSVTSIATGAHSYTAIYSGSSTYASSTSPVVTVVAGQTTTALSSTNSAPAAGASITLNATVTSSSATGNMSFSDNGVSLGTATLSGGAASFPVNSITAGVHNFTAAYSGSSSYASSVSANLLVTAGAATSTSLAVSTNYPAVGSTVTLLASVTSPTAGPASGNLTFLDGSTTLAVQPYIAAFGQAVYTLPSISAGSHTFTVVWSGGPSFSSGYAQPSSSAPLIITTAAQATTTALSSSNLSPATGSNITLTGKMPSSAVSGTITFSDNGSTIGTGQLSSGVATYTISSIAVGPHSFTAAYSGSSSYASSTSSVLSLTAGQTSTALSSSSTSPAPGANITLTATVSSSAETGTVTFYDAGTSLGSGTISGTTATYVVSAITPGLHSYTASYNGNSSYANSTSPVVTVTSGQTTTTVLSPSSLSPATGANIVLVATITGGSPSGSVVFADGGLTIGTVTLSSGKASYSVNAITNGYHYYTATYLGNTIYAQSISSQVVVNAQTPTTTSIVSSNLVPIPGASIALVAEVFNTQLGPNSYAYGVSGTVTFMDGNTVLGSGTLSSGLAIWNIGAISSGAHSYTAVYNGGINSSISFAASTSPALTVTALPATTTVLTASSSSPAAGSNISLTASVTGNAPTGSVSFLDGSTTIGTGTLSSGKATFSVSAIVAGTHNYTAVYGGSSTVGASTSAAVVVTTLRASTTTTLSASNPSPNPGTNITLTAAVSGSGATGSVTFLDGSTTLGSGKLSTGSVTYVVSSIAVGSHSYTAVYSGDNSYLASTSAAISVASLNATTTTVSSSNMTPAPSASITLTGVVVSELATGTVNFFDGATNVGAGTISNGLASYTISSVASGSHSYTAVYVGNTTYAASTSSAINVLALPPTTTSLSVSNSSPAPGANITLSATVASSSATGTITFKDGSSTLGTGTLSSGVATYTVSSIATGFHNYTATYSGNASYGSSVSPLVSVSALNATTTSVAATSLSPAPGSNITLTATVASSSATGTVTFKDGSTTLGTGTLSGGVATYTVSSIAAGGHSYTAVYGGNASYATSASSAVVVSSLNTTTTTLSSSSISPAAGSSITLTATVASNSATGTITFKDGSTTLGTGTLSSGVATYTVSAVAAGSHSYTAVYGGSASYATSTSSAVAVATLTATTTSLSVSNGAPTPGANITLTATVASSSATGTVTFLDGGTTLGTGTLSSGVATYAVSSIAAGSHSYTAVYVGNSTYATSTSAAILVSALNATTTSLSASNTAPAPGANITLTATVASNSATGTVTFRDGSTTLGTGTLSGGVATYTVSSIAAGSHSYTAVYGGSTTYAASTSAAVAVTTLTATTTTLSASNTAPGPGANITLTATIASSSATGTVTFKDGSTTLGTGTLSSGLATYTVSSIVAGLHSYTAVYGGSATYAPSTSSAVAVSSLNATTTSLAASSLSPTPGANITLTATVASSSATGTVTFKDGSTTLGTGTLSSGVATYTVSSIVAGSHSYTAAYGGSATYAPSTSSAVLVSSLNATTTTLSSSSVSPAAGSNVTLTATVVSSSATGIVTIKDGSTTLGTGTLSSGVATYTVSSIAAGSHSYTAVYGGSSTYATSTSAAVTVATLTATTTSLSASSTSPAPGSNITLTATVASSSATGTVTFKDGSTTLGTGTLSSGVATYAVSSITAGSHSYTAVYGGNSTYATSTSTAVAVSALNATTTSLSASNTAPAPGANITLTATVASSSATGTVTFKDGSTTLGAGTLSGGVAMYTVSSIAAGSHSYTAVYGGSTTYAPSTSAAVAVTTLTATTSTLTASNTTPAPGASITLTASVMSSSATGTVTFLDGGTALGTGTLSNGVATYAVSAIAAGSHSYTAVYGGNSTYATSTSAAVVVSALNATTTTLSSSNVSPAPGSNITLTATVASSSATGTVTFKDGATTLGTGTLSSGIATYTVSSIAAGSHSYAAVYGGSATYATSTSSAVAVTSLNATTTTLSSSSASPAVGASITLTAMVASSSATGTVTFLDGSTTLGTGTLSSGIATYIVSSIAAGSHSYTAIYGGNSTYATSTSSAVSVISSGPTLGLVTPSVGVPGVSITVSGSGFGASQGTNTLVLGGSALTISSWSNTSISAVLPTSAQTGSIAVTVGGVTSNGKAFTVVNPATGYVRPLTFAHSMVPNTDQANFPVLISGTYPFLATVANGGRVQSSSGFDVVFTSDFAGQSLLNYEIDSYSPATGAAAFWVRMPNLSHTTDTTIYMWYGIPGLTASQENKPGVWSSNYVGVWHVSSGTSLSLSDSTTNGNNATNNGATSGSGVIGGAMATNGTTYATIGTPASLSNLAQGNATFSAWINTASGVGGQIMGKDDNNGSKGWSLVENPSTHQIEFMVVYGGSDLRATSAASLSAGAWNYISVSLVGNASAGGVASIYLNGSLDSVTTGGSGGTTDDSAQPAYLANTTYGDQASSPLNGSADEFRLSNSIRSADWIATEYANQSSPGSFFNVGAEQTGGGQTATTISLSSSNVSPTAGASITLTATVASSSATGTVTFLDGGTTLGTGTLSSGVATYTISSIAAGSHSYTAFYGGNATYAPSTSSALPVTVPAATTTSLASSSLSPAPSANITLTATVTSSTATGTVTFKDGTTTLGTGTLSSGIATYAVSSIAVGSHSYTAIYGGSSSYAASTSPAVTVTVTASGGAIAPGNSASFNITTAGQNAQYTFSGTAGQEVNVVLTNSTFSGNCYTVAVNVLKPDGTQLTSGSACGAGTVDLPFLTLPTTGTYTIVVAPQNGATGSGTITLSADQHGAITLSNSVSFNITTAGQNAQYTFSGTANQEVNLILTSSTFAGNCYTVAVNIMKPDGTQLTSSSACGSGNVDIPFVTLPTTGTYTIVVTPQNGLTGGGTLTLSTDQHGTTSAGSSVAFNITTAGQNAQYTFSGTANQQVNVVLTNSTFSGNCYTVAITILNPNGTQLTSVNGCGSSNVDIPFVTLPTTGTYTIVVAPVNGLTGGGTLTLSTDQNGTATIGNSVAFNITTAGQNAQYTFSGTAGQEVNVALTNSTFSGNCYTVAVNILKPDGTQLASVNGCGSSNVDVSFVTLPTTGTYTIVVAPQNGTTGGGTITLSADQHGTINHGGSAAFTISTPGQNAQYTFSGTASQAVNVALINSAFSGSCYSVAVSILNPDGSQLTSVSGCGSSNVNLNSVTLPTAGTYTIVVAPVNAGTGGGTITLN